MRFGMIGLGRMGANMTQRLLRAGHEGVVYDTRAERVHALAELGATGAASPDELVRLLPSPRLVWMMLPPEAVDDMVATLATRLQAGDVLVDGGNSHYRDSMRRARELQARGLHYLDVGTSGGVWGLEHGFCLMIGGAQKVVQRLEPIFAALAPSIDAAPRTPERGGRDDHAERGYLHCGESGAGHFVKMVHNGIEYGVMAAYAEGFNLLQRTGKEHDDFPFALELAEIAELWRRGSVIRSWLLDLIAQALLRDPALAGFRGHVPDSGEGRWTVQTAIDAAVPVPVISAALFARFDSRNESAYANKLLSALRQEFGGHLE